MLHFDCDYMEGAHPLILERLIATNFEQTSGYGNDPYSQQAKEKIREACGCPDAQIHFLVGGTQTNATVIDGILRSYEGVIAAETGHINVHEAGAIEAGGHKVITLPQTQGKLTAEKIDNYITTFYNDATYEHMVAPGMVYISYPTEYGTLYSKKELEVLKETCHKHHIPLFIDGARLGYGLASPQADITLKDLAKLCDVFYIGGTKIGALFGEAVVVTNSSLLNNFFPIIKQHGALLAKGRLLGIQFATLFTDNLYFHIAHHAIKMAEKLKTGFQEKGYSLYINSPTNQQFVILKDEQISKIREHATFEIWGTIDSKHSIARFATSWATREEDIDRLLDIL